MPRVIDPTPLHSAAGAALTPLGLFAPSGSGSWLDDHGWWVIGVDFEVAPAGTARVVAYADFLWHAGGAPRRSVCARVRERGRLLDQDGPLLTGDCRSAEQLRGLAARAAVEVVAWREGFRTLAAWAGYLDRSAEEGNVWRQVDAAVATALNGDRHRAQQWFDRVLDRPVRPELYPDPDADEIPQAQRFCRRLLAELTDPDAFRAAVAQDVADARARLHLPPHAAG